MRFLVLKLQFLLQKWIQDSPLFLGHQDYAIPITENYHLNKTPEENGLEFSLLHIFMVSFWVISSTQIKKNL